MEIKILANTVENDRFDMMNVERLSGKMAGICYMKDKYFGTAVSDDYKAYDRFDRVISTEHHSIADHFFITVLIEGCSKFIATLLNGMIRFYNTSEKSGRYTVMTREHPIYDKWISIFMQEIYKYDPTLDDKLVEKLALENARYVLNMFAPYTTMSYTTSARCWAYIYELLEGYLISQYGKYLSDFDARVYEEVEQLATKIKDIGIVSEKIHIKPFKKIDFLARQTEYPIWDAKEYIGETYMINYDCTLVELAQFVRHRTLDYYMDFDGKNGYRFYVPKIIRGTEFEQQWIDDLRQLMADDRTYFPNAIIMSVWETGNIANKMMQCDERLCARVQTATFDIVKQTVERFRDIDYVLSDYCKYELSRHLDLETGEIKMKCANQKCKEPCHWGPIRGKDKLV